MKKNIFDRIQDNFAKQIENFEKREDANVLKKVPFWMIFFFPYAIYLLLFKTKIKKIKKIFIGIFFTFLLIISFDIVKNPNRVYNNVAKQSYDEFVLNNKDLKLSESLYVNKYNHFEFNNKIYFSFVIYDKLNMYYGIFQIDNYNKDYKLVSLYDVDCNFSNVYTTKDFEKVKDVHPVILNFIMSNNTDINFDNISNIKDVKEIEFFKNIINQEITINNKAYLFEFNDFEVLNVKDIKSDENLYSLNLHNSLEAHLSPSSHKLLIKNFDKNYELVGYNYFNSEHYYNLLVADEPYCIKYNPGQSVDLLQISDIDEFSSHLKSLMVK